MRDSPLERLLCVHIFLLKENVISIEQGWAARRGEREILYASQSRKYGLEQGV
jgi:hypothetical protein